MGESAVLLGIVTKNRAGLLRKAIKSSLAQKAVNLCVAVLDDGSSDDTTAVKDEFPQIQWTRWEENRGLIEARNYLMRSATTDYFVSLDDDAYFLEGDEIALATRCMEENPSVGAIAFDILSPDRPDSADRRPPYPTSMFIGCGHVLRITAARQVGFYESAPGVYGGEEKDLCLRLIDAGYKTVLLPGVHVWHEKATLERHTSVQHRSGVCNDLVMAFRRTPGWVLPLALIAKAGRHLFFSLKHGLTKPCLEGFSLFVRALPRIWASRKPVRASTLRTFMELRGQ